MTDVPARNKILGTTGRLLLTVELARGTQRSAAVAYALLISAHCDAGAEVWRPINEALVERWGDAGRERVKAAAWRIHEAAAALERQMPARQPGGEG
jgi:hypothetical protein